MLRLGVIGAGKWGVNHLRTLSEIDCKLVGLADLNKDKKVLADSNNIKFYTEYEKLLPLVDAVTVAVPTDMHYDVVKKCINAGKHVMVEKPITTKYESAKELVELAKKNKVLLGVGYLFRFNAAVNALKDEIPKIGQIHYVTARYIHSNKPPRTDSGVIFNFGIHLIDILNYVLDKKPFKVACKKINYLNPDREDAAILNLHYDSFIANLEKTWFHPLKKRDMWVIASDAKIYADFLEQKLIKYPIKSQAKANPAKGIELPIKKNEPLKEELKAFCGSIKNGSENFDGEEELMTTRICELALESAESNKELKIDE
jgi:UDP-N-acetylglucosamine 3-dehydrogenase